MLFLILQRIFVRPCFFSLGSTRKRFGDGAFTPSRVQKRKKDARLCRRRRQEETRSPSATGGSVETLIPWRYVIALAQASDMYSSPRPSPEPVTTNHYEYQSQVVFHLCLILFPTEHFVFFCILTFSHFHVAGESGMFPLSHVIANVWCSLQHSSLSPCPLPLFLSWMILVRQDDAAKANCLEVRRRIFDG